MPGRGVPNNPVGMGCFGALIGFILFGGILAWLGRYFAGPGSLLLYATLIAFSAIAGFAITYRRQRPRYEGQSLGAWIGFDFIAANIGCVAGFVLVALLAAAGVVNNEAWLAAGAVGGGLLGFAMYHATFGLWQRRAKPRI